MSKPKCKYCGSDNIRKNGNRYTQNGKQQRYICAKCGRDVIVDNVDSINHVIDSSKINKDAVLKFLKSKPSSIEDLCNQFNVSPRTINDVLVELGEDCYNLVVANDKVHLNLDPPVGGHSTLDSRHWHGSKFKLGFVSDSHLCSDYAREDFLNMLYDIFEEEGITDVYHAGNWIDGEARFNKNNIFVHGMTNQIQYAVENYPYREGITTHFISGDDHEGWYSQREGINIGEYLQLKREQSGKFDMKYLGYVEADIELNPEEFRERQFLRIMHPGGGSAYAISYKSQKIVEATQPGEKPALLVIGHYHKALFHPIRTIYTIQVPSCQDQTPFLRKLGIESQVGGVICTFYRDDDGIINRIMPDFIMSFNKQFYIGKDKYWK